MQKKIYVVYREGSMIDQICPSGLQSFTLEISHWMMLHDQIDQLKLVAIRDINWEQSVLYHVEDSRHTQYIQIKNWKSFAQAWLY